MSEYLYLKVTNGVATTNAMNERAMLALLADGTPALSALTPEELLANGLARCGITPYPQDGYQYAMSEPVAVDGQWSVSWVRQESPRRDSNAAVLGRLRRRDRDALLSRCDWTQVADAPLTTEQKLAWSVYRQALRDVPAQTNFPFAVTWPAEPVFLSPQGSGEV